MQFEYATFWIWDTETPNRAQFDKLKTLQGKGWKVVGDFNTIPDFHNAGLWVLRRPIAQVARKCA